MKHILIGFISLIMLPHAASAAVQNVITCSHDTASEGKGGSGESFAVSIEKVTNDVTRECVTQWVFEGASWKNLVTLKYVGQNAQAVTQVQNKFYAIGPASFDHTGSKVVMSAGSCVGPTSLSLMINSSTGLARLTLTKHGWDKRLLFPELWKKTNVTWAFSAQQFPLYFTKCTPDDPKSDRFPIQ